MFRTLSLAGSLRIVAISGGRIVLSGFTLFLNLGNTFFFKMIFCDVFDAQKKAVGKWISNHLLCRLTVAAILSVQTAYNKPEIRRLQVVFGIGQFLFEFWLRWLIFERGFIHLRLGVGQLLYEESYVRRRFVRSEPHNFFERFKRVKWDQVRSISLGKGNIKM